ncbi:CpsB/CapC family capsule biosynthesis tyrosine phosphatase [Tamlana sp. 2201CG12-4]|uniref:tyrosine-protein phosphatase n=1 Tax=Tamlana sp. 2201CG12-4 TaxID=3112582 RepID=UPI002DB91E5B|nr:CpsB/CapC family capsule biosynthesis tyrosine phosphatase [Tamlana sp. 2201CG12-4]MEC3908053.1 CpsB/CapC family capsule biosynthesis tyrosine phosphatase [Tamlana sp. 2201CG12-4]
MFSFFSKKFFLKDLLEDFVDIHNHILPGIDDGAKNIEDSLNLIRKMQELGIKQFIPTPHVMHDFYPNTDETIGNAYQNLLEALDSKTQSKITINPAAEYMLDIHFEKFLKTNYLFTLKAKHILVELSYFQPSINLEEIIFKIKTKGYIPILAHPERYSYYHNNLGYYEKLKQLGCYFQLNLLSLSNHYGVSVNKTGNYLMENKLIDFVGTDIHHEKHIEKLSNLKLNKKSKMHLIEIINNTNQTFSVI